MKSTELKDRHFTYGLCMKEGVRRAIGIARNLRYNVKVERKMGRDGRMSDIVTNADRAAQKSYLKLLGKYCRGVGVIAEEDGLFIPSTPGSGRLTMIIDPLDGTNAYRTGKLSKVGTMISLLSKGKVLAAYVGDAAACDMYGYGPYSDKVYRIGLNAEKVTHLKVDDSLPLSAQRILRRATPGIGNPLTNGSLGLKRGTFRDSRIVRGSIGLSFARMWRGSVGGILLPAGHYTPWDLCPIVGISQKLGFVFLRCTGKSFVPFRPKTDGGCVHLSRQTLVVHRSRLSELRASLSSPA